MTFRQALDHYVNQGFSVIPCGLNKKPVIETWAEFQNRQPTAEECDRWAKDTRCAGIALICGQLSDLTVIDCDTSEAIAAIEALIPDTLAVPITTSPRGGQHYHFRFTPGLISRNGTAKGVDVKTEGGYIIDMGRTDKGSYKRNGTQLAERGTMAEALLEFLKKGQALPDPAVQGPPLTQGRRDEDMFHLALQLFKDKHPREEVERIVLTAAKAATPPFPERETRAKIESAWKRMQKNRSSENDAIGLMERDPTTVKVRSIPWLWPGVVATHMATALTGDAGEGKSLVAVDMTARLSCGKTFPAYDEKSPAFMGHTFYVTSEGVPEMILVPRLMAAGADLSKVKIIEGVQTRSGDFSIFDVTKHLPMIAQRARDFPDLRLIVVDPIASFLPERINPSQQNQVRQAMDQVSNLAYNLGVAAVVIMHFNKVPGARANHRTSGSVQFMASVKMSWSVVRREGDPRDVRLLVPQKSNITGAYKSLSFTIKGHHFPSPGDPKDIIKTAKIEYGALVDENPETLICPPVESDTNVANAIRFLKRKLAEGTTLYAVKLIDEAEEAGIPKWALYKAKDRLGVQHDKEGQFQGRTFWFMLKEEK